MAIAVLDLAGLEEPNLLVPRRQPLRLCRTESGDGLIFPDWSNLTNVGWLAGAKVTDQHGKSIYSTGSSNVGLWDVTKFNIYTKGAIQVIFKCAGLIASYSCLWSFRNAADTAYFSCVSNTSTPNTQTRWQNQLNSVYVSLTENIWYNAGKPLLFMTFAWDSGQPLRRIVQSVHNAVDTTSGSYFPTEQLTRLKFGSGTSELNGGLYHARVLRDPTPYLGDSQAAKRRHLAWMRDPFADLIPI